MTSVEKLSLAEYIEKSTKAYEDKTHHGHCSKCGGCCSALIPLGNEDISRIKNYLLTHKIVPEHKSSKNTLDMICPFWSRKNQCLIYEVRPLICRTFKCNRTIPKLIKKYAHLFMDSSMAIQDMWYVFFHENRPALNWKEIFKTAYTLNLNSSH